MSQWAIGNLFANAVQAIEMGVQDFEAATADPRRLGSSVRNLTAGAHAFEVPHAWPHISAHREFPLQTGGFVDIAVYEGQEYTDGTPITVVTDRIADTVRCSRHRRSRNRFLDRSRTSRYRRAGRIRPKRPLAPLPQRGRGSDCRCTGQTR